MEKYYCYEIRRGVYIYKIKNEYFNKFWKEIILKNV